jgi:hypothetical protein
MECQVPVVPAALGRSRWSSQFDSRSGSRSGVVAGRGGSIDQRLHRLGERAEVMVDDVLHDGVVGVEVGMCQVIAHAGLGDVLEASLVVPAQSDPALASASWGARAIHPSPRTRPVTAAGAPRSAHVDLDAPSASLSAIPMERISIGQASGSSSTRKSMSLPVARRPVPPTRRWRRIVRGGADDRLEVVTVSSTSSSERPLDDVSNLRFGHPCSIVARSADPGAGSDRALESPPRRRFRLCGDGPSKGTRQGSGCSANLCVDSPRVWPRGHTSLRRTVRPRGDST